jgi:hypothetical protein
MSIYIPSSEPNYEQVYRTLPTVEKEEPLFFPTGNPPVIDEDDPFIIPVNIPYQHDVSPRKYDVGPIGIVDEDGPIPPDMPPSFLDNYNTGSDLEFGGILEVLDRIWSDIWDWDWAGWDEPPGRGTSTAAAQSTPVTPQPSVNLVGGVPQTRSLKKKLSKASSARKSSVKKRMKKSVTKKGGLK